MQVDEAAYEKLLECVRTSDINVCDDVPSGAGGSGGAKLTNPLGGTAHQVDGADRCIYASLRTLTRSNSNYLQLRHAVQTISEHTDSQRTDGMLERWRFTLQ